MEEHSRRERVERRISAAVCIAMCATGVLVQIATTLLLTAFLREKAGYVYLLLQLVAIVNAVGVYQRPGSPSFKLAWMCLLIASPVAGMLLFWLWGGLRQSKRLRMKALLPMRRQDADLAESEANLQRLRARSPAWGRLAAYLRKRDFLLYRNTRARYFADGSAFFADLLRRLEEAERYIFLEYYILAEGRIWDRIFAALKQRAARGVEICVIFDDFGNLFRFSGAALQAMQDAGIAVQMFNPVHRYISRLYFNYRDHRKIAVIDGQTAYTGGINLADEYANLVERFGHWKDSAVRLDGDGAWGLAEQFLRMWKMLGRAFLHEDAYYRPRASADTLSASPVSASPVTAEEGFCQPFADGPLSNPDNPIEETYLQLISSARKTLYLTTPYYAVEESMQKALCIAADAGVDVRLCVPAVPDHKLTYLVSETYWGELLRHGVRIYQYTPGFLHAKSVVADGEAALLGSTNMDYRTFQLQYECGVLFYHMPLIADLTADLERVMEHSGLYTLSEWRERPLPRRVAASVLKLGAIWL